MGHYLQDPPYKRQEIAALSLLRDNALRDYRSYLETQCRPVYFRKVRPMKETKQTIKFRATDVFTDHPTYPYGGPHVTSVRGECLPGGQAAFAGLSDEMREEMILALQQRLDVEITIAVKRPETKLEEVERIQQTIGKTQALDKAKEYLAGVK